MAATATVQFRLEPEQKKAAEALFKSMGLTLTSAFSLFIQQSLNLNALPFPVLGKRQSETIMECELDAAKRMKAFETFSKMSTPYPEISDYKTEFGKMMEERYESVR